MTSQRGFWDDDSDESIDARFRKFHAAHPEVYEHLRDLCFQWRESTGSPWSIKGAFEVLRWERHIKGLPDPEEDFKLNNNYHSRYARLLMESEPALDGLFELRRLASVGS